MNAILFVREDLLKASHYKLITVPGHVHSGKWVDPYQREVLVSDDHNDLNVAFHTMHPEEKSAIILSHATKMQQEASSAAAVSGWKKSAMAGQNPTNAQWAGFFAASSDKQAMLYGAATSAGHAMVLKPPTQISKPTGNTSEPKAPQAIKTSPQGQAPAVAATPAAPAVEPAKPASGAEAGVAGQAAVAVAAAGGSLVAVSADAKAKLDSLPWAKLMLDASNVNAGPNNKKITAIKDAAYAGNVGQLHAMTFGSNSYAKKQALAAKTAIAALTEAGVAPAQAVPEPVVQPEAAAPIPAPPPAPKTAKPLHTFTGDGLESYVSVGTGKMAGKFSVSLKDTDAGQFVPTVTFYPTEDAAIKSAKAAAGIKDAIEIQYTSSGVPLKPDTPSFKDAILEIESYIADEHLQDLKSAVKNLTGAVSASAKAALAYAEAGVQYLEKKAAAGPKDGDTKPGADGSNLVFKNGRWHKYVDADEHGEVPPILVPVPDVPALKDYYDKLAADGQWSTLQDLLLPSTGLKQSVKDYINSLLAGQPAAAQDDSAGHKAAVAAFAGGSFYQKEALKKLKAEHGAGWDAMHPTQQLDLAQAKYQTLQGAASQAAAVSGWKKHMLAGQVPTPSEVKAFGAMAASDPAKAGAIMAEVQNKIGGDKLAVLVTQAHAKAANAPVAQPAKVFVTTPPVITPPVAASVPQAPASPSLAAAAPVNQSLESVLMGTDDDNAADDIASAYLIDAGLSKEAYDEVIHALDMAGFLPLSNKFVDAKLKAYPVAAAPAENTPYQKFMKTNDDVAFFIHSFVSHGKPVAQGKSIDEWLEPSTIAAFNALPPDEKMEVASAISFYGPHKLKLFQDWLGAQNAKAAAPAVVVASAHLYHNTEPGHNKFWSVSISGNQMQTKYGSIGTKGSATIKTFGSNVEASKAMADLVSKKKKAGYSFVTGGIDHEYQGGAPAPVAVAPVAQPAPAAAPAAAPASSWVHEQCDIVHGGSPSITLTAPDGHELFVTYSAGNYKVGSTTPNGNPGVYDYFKHPEDAAAQLAILCVDHSALVASPTDKEIAKLSSPVAAAPGPQDGDTKQGVNGDTLVFKNGHWHMQPGPFESVVVPDFEAISPDKFGPLYANVAKELQAAVVTGGLAGLKKHITYHKSGRISIAVTKLNVKLSNIAAVPLSGTPLQKARHAAMHKFVMDLTAAAKQLPKAKKVVFTTAAPASPASTTIKPSQVKSVAGKPPITVIDGWQHTGPQKGSNPGGKFKDSSGQEWYCKFPTDTDVAMNELLAAKFYEMLGVSVPSIKLVEQGGKVGIASKWVDGISKGTASQLAQALGAHHAFALDAWLGNWDVVGMSNDNLMLDKSGAAVHVDVGGALVYRAQGGKKGADFGDTVPELETLLDAKKNPTSAAVFAGMTKDKMSWGLVQLNKMMPSQIEEMCKISGPGSDADKAALAKTLIARRAFILAKFGIVDQWSGAKQTVDESNLPVDVSSLPPLVDYANYYGPGKGLSSSPHFNAANTEALKEMNALAAAGNLTALKKYQFNSVDKVTGASLGKLPITDNLSKTVKNQWVALCDLLASSAKAPALQMLNLPFFGGGTASEVSINAGYFSPGETIKTVSPDKLVGYWLKLGHVGANAIASLIPAKTLYFKQKTENKAISWFNAASANLKGWIGSVLGNGDVHNHYWSAGLTQSAKGVPLNKLTNAAYSEAVEHEEGTVISRWMSMDSAMQSQVEKEGPGLVFQNTDGMCCSIFKNWGDQGHFASKAFLNIRYAEGAKALDSYGTGKYNGKKVDADGHHIWEPNKNQEMEVTTLMGARFVVLGVKKGNSADPNGLTLDLLMLPPHAGFLAEVDALAALGKSLAFVRCDLLKGLSWLN